MAFDIKDELKKLPDRPGVYLMHDAAGEVIYVGKAKRLKRRVRQYFSNSETKSLKIRKMISCIAWFETVVTDSETEALILENNLIKEHRPRYNTMLTDDKTYPFIKLTAEEYPAIMLVRRVKKDGAKYFGPYPDAGSARENIKLVGRIYKIRTCARKIMDGAGAAKSRPCLNFHIGRCDAPCTGNVTKDDYAQSVKEAQDFLKGGYRGVEAILKSRMDECANKLDFESAATYRDMLSSVKRLGERQKITDVSLCNRDILAVASDGDMAIVQVFFVRDGRLVRRGHFRLAVAEGDEKRQILTDFVKQFYSGSPYLPQEILVPQKLTDKNDIEEWLSQCAGHRVTVIEPVRGKKHRLVQLAQKNAELILANDREKEKRDMERTAGAQKSLAALIGLSGVRRIEAYDISNTAGKESVGSMVVFEDGRPKRTDYRRFRIRTVEGADDTASMREVLERRFRRGLCEREAIGHKSKDAPAKFADFPDLILADGGKGQANAVSRTLESLGLDIPVCGMVKDDRHNTRGLYCNGAELEMDRGSDEFALVTRIQDEAHRFAVEYHRRRRGRAQTRSVLDDIQGVGPVRRKALMRKFKTRANLESATAEQIAAMPEMDKNTARRVYAYFHDGEIPEIADS